MDLYNQGARQLLQLRFTGYCRDTDRERNTSSPASNATATRISILFPFILCSTDIPVDFQKNGYIVLLQLQPALLPGTEEQPQPKPPRAADGRGGEGATQAKKRFLGD